MRARDCGASTRAGSCTIFVGGGGRVRHQRVPARVRQRQHRHEARLPHDARLVRGDVGRRRCCGRAWASAVERIWGAWTAMTYRCHLGWTRISLTASSPRCAADAAPLLLTVAAAASAAAAHLRMRMMTPACVCQAEWQNAYDYAFENYTRLSAGFLLGAWGGRLCGAAVDLCDLCLACVMRVVCCFLHGSDTFWYVRVTFGCMRRGRGCEIDCARALGITGPARSVYVRSCR